MTREQQEKIRRMRLQIIPYAQIAKELGIAKNTVKSYCYRNGLHTEVVTQKNGTCLECGKPLKAKKTRPPVYCSNVCKIRYWRVHRENPNLVEYVCEHCGRVFEASPNPPRKYCSIECYRNRNN